MTKDINIPKEWEDLELGSLLEYEQPTKYLVDSTKYNNEYATPVLTAGKTFILGYTNETSGIFNKNLPVIIFDDFTTASKFVNFPFKAKSSAMKILKAKDDFNIKFIYEAMQFIKFEIGGHGRHWISIFSQLTIPVPSTKEQEGIAEVLENWDEMIELLTNKVQLLEDRKKALMQKLLTPQLKDNQEFIRNIFTYKNGNAFEKSISDTGLYNVISLNSIDIKGNLKNTHKKTNITLNSLLKKNDLVMILSDVAHGNLLGLSAIIPDNNYVLNQRVGMLRLINNIKYDLTYLKYAINFNQRFFKRLGQGSSQLNLSKDDILNIKISTPPLPEQNQIAEVLTEVDNGIKLVKDQLANYKKQKKALMQKLLTGNWRLPEYRN